jgi:hypothetical protein
MKKFCNIYKCTKEEKYFVKILILNQKKSHYLDVLISPKYKLYNNYFKY